MPVPLDRITKNHHHALSDTCIPLFLSWLHSRMLMPLGYGHPGREYRARLSLGRGSRTPGRPARTPRSLRSCSLRGTSQSRRWGHACMPLCATNIVNASEARQRPPLSLHRGLGRVVMEQGHGHRSSARRQGVQTRRLATCGPWAQVSRSRRRPLRARLFCGKETVLDGDIQSCWPGAARSATSCTCSTPPALAAPACGIW